MSERTPGDPLSTGGLWRWLAVVVSPLVVTVLVLTALYRTVGLTPVEHAPLAVYAAANVLVVALLAGRLSSDGRTAVFRYRVPGAEEAGAAVVAALAMVFAFDPLASLAARTLGGGTSATSVETTVGAVVLGVSAVAVAPVVEEVLYRGLALGALRARYGTAVAVVGSSLLFGVVHLAIGGVSGVVSASLSGLVLGGLAVRYDGLAGAGLAHALNNAYWVAVALGALPDVVPA